MLKTLVQLLGDDSPVLHRYAWMAVSYAVLSGLTITTLVPIFTCLLGGDLRGAAMWLAVLAAGMVVCWAWRRKVERLGVAVGVAVLQGARHRMGDHVARLPVGWFTPENTARLGHVITQGMSAVAQLPAHVFTPVISGAVTPLVMVVALFALHWPLGLVALVALPLLVGVSRWTARLGARADQQFQNHFAHTSQRLVEFAQAQSVLRAFNGGGGATRVLQDAMEQQRQSGKRLIYVSSLSAVLNTWAVHAVFAALLVTSALWFSVHLGGALDVGGVSAVAIALLLVNRFTDPLLDVAAYSEVLRGARGQLDAVREIFAVEPLPEPETPQAPRDASVELRDVHFRYTPGGSDVLRGVTLHIEPGSMVALVGASGSGKTTLVRLVERFFDVSQGSVRLGGVDVRQISSEQLGVQISRVFQDSYLFAGTLAANIRFGKPDASDAQVLEAARQAGVTEIIARLPLGLNSPVGEGGTRLSGGERQRVAIARALIKDAPILLVDEATAALDADNQAVIAEALARLRGKRTLIVIAHQLSTVAMADHIVVMEDGRVTEQGAPEQLRASGERYAHFLAQRKTAKGWRMAQTSQI